MFKKFSELITESYKNLFNESEKLQYADKVWELLRKAYASQGGIKGSGFESKEDMVKNIEFWKLNIVHGEIKALAMYRDKAGRKRVAIATDGTKEGKEKLLDLMVADLKTGRAYMEISGLSLKFIAKHMNIKAHAVSLNQVRHKLKEDVEAADEHDTEVKAHPELKDYFYKRKIGADGHTHTKIMLGNIHAEPIKMSFK